MLTGVVIDVTSAFLQIDRYDDLDRWPGIVKPGQSMWRSHTEAEKKDVLSHRPLA